MRDGWHDHIGARRLIVEVDGAPGEGRPEAGEGTRLVLSSPGSPAMATVWLSCFRSFTASQRWTCSRSGASNLSQAAAEKAPALVGIEKLIVATQPNASYHARIEPFV